jgi:hypothetical protein
MEFPRHRLDTLLELAVRLLSSRKPKTDNSVFARELLSGFQDICQRYGLDAVEIDVDNTGPVAARLAEANLDGGGPRNAKPQQVVDSLGLTFVDAPEGISLDDKVRVDELSAISRVLEPALALPALRDTIIATARPRIDENHFRAFEQIIAHLDDRGVRLNRTPKVPLDALHAIQRLLAEARHEILSRAAREAIDRAKELLPAEAAERIDQPVTNKLTPRDVAILRACDPRIPLGAVGIELLAGLSDTIPIAWRAAEKPVRPYGASQKFTVGELIEHPKFGRGTITSVLNGRMDVEFADTKLTLVCAK